MHYITLYRNIRWFRKKSYISHHFLRWLVFNTLQEAMDYKLAGYEQIRIIEVDCIDIESDHFVMTLFPQIKSEYDGETSYPTTL